MELRFRPAPSCFVYRHERLVQHDKSLPDLPHLSVRIGQEAERVRPLYLCPRGLYSHQALVHADNPLCHLSPLGQHPALQDRPLWRPVRKTLLSREVYRCIRPLLGFLHLPTLMIEEGNPIQNIGQAGRMGQLLGQRERLRAPCARLVRITEIPEDEGHTAEANRPFVLAEERDMGVVPAGIVVGNPLLEMPASGNELSQPETGDAEGIMGLYEEHRVLYALGEAEKLLPELAGRL